MTKKSVGLPVQTALSPNTVESFVRFAGTAPNKFDVEV
jgi:hypothetical protein